ncbi:MAG TPA: sensor histidine kinase [Ktedonobacteraceae bacterium]|nr:sensor histidine kinase [Ktedonobacteraceae bacterium]
MVMKRVTRPFRQLQGKLTLSYTLNSVVTFLFIEVTLIIIILGYVNLNISGLVLNNLKQQAPQATSYFVHGTPDREALALWLHIIQPTVFNVGPGNSQPLFLVAVDAQGQVLASTDARSVPVNAPILTQLNAASRADLASVLNGDKGTANGLVSHDAGNTLVAIMPIEGGKGNVQGALIMKVVQPNIFQLVLAFLQFILFSVVVVTTIAAIGGLVFGSLTSRGITRRLRRLASASDKWSHGDFTAIAIDTSADELGQMARQFNRMAEQLRNLLQARQKLASLEERNRLARDLHDSVKQQVFAVGMQIGATKVLLRRDVDAAEGRLLEAEKLVRQAQQELTTLIRELRPVALEGKSLVDALREMATAWSQQTGIVANVRVEGTQAMPLTVEEALFRIAQEALSNVARHSKATLVQLVLTIADEDVTLSITDNGQGFDTTHQAGMGVGLLSMQERMKALGGDVQLESTPGKGTCIIVHCKRAIA